MAGVLALLVQMMAWGIGLPADAASGRDGSAASIVICTVEGLKRVAVDADGVALADSRTDDGSAGGGTGGADAGGGHCPLCPLVGGAGLPPAPFAVSTPGLVVLAVASAATDDAVLDSRISSGWRARAPPRTA